MREEFIETRNYIKLNEAFQGLKDLPASAPKMGLGYGSFGLGKTFSLEKIAFKENAILLRAVQTWTKSSLLTELCEELNIDTQGKSSNLYRRIVESLLADPQIIIVDEIDTLLKSTKYEVLETIRDIHDETGVSIFMIGMEEANAKLKKHRHFYSRIVSFVLFENISKEDIEKLCKLSEITVSNDLIQYFHQKYPNLRQITVLLLRVEKYCDMNDLESIDLQTFKSSGAEYGDNKQ